MPSPARWWASRTDLSTHWFHKGPAAGGPALSVYDLDQVGPSSSVVIAGLVPAISIKLARHYQHKRDHRDNPRRCGGSPGDDDEAIIRIPYYALNRFASASAPRVSSPTSAPTATKV